MTLIYSIHSKITPQIVLIGVVNFMGDLQKFQYEVSIMTQLSVNWASQTLIILYLEKETQGLSQKPSSHLSVLSVCSLCGYRQYFSFALEQYVC